MGIINILDQNIHLLKTGDLTRCDICINVYIETDRHVCKIKCGYSRIDIKLIEENSHITTEIHHENKIKFISKTKSL